MVARAAGAPRPRRRGPGGDRLVGVGGDGRGHQTSRIIGSTKGLRWKRWFTSWRTAVRTRALVASRSHGIVRPPLGERGQHGRAQLLDEGLALLDVEHAARGDLGPGHHRALGVHGQRDGNHAVLGQDLAVAQHHGADVADPLAVDQDAPGRKPLEPPSRARADLDAGAVLDEKDPFRRDPHALGQPRVPEQVAILAVHRHEVSRPGEAQHQLEILLAGVTGDVDEGVVLVEDLGAATVERVDHAADGALVAGDDTGRDDDQVARGDLHVLVLAGRHQGQRGVRLALAAGGEDHLLVRRQLDHRLQRLHQARRHAQVAEIGGDRDVLFHRASEQRHPATEALGQREHLLDAVDVRGERRQDDPARRAGEALGQRRAHVDLRARVAGAVHVRRVRAEQGHTPLAQLGEAPVVGGLAVERARVELEIAGEDHGADGRVDRQTDAVDDRVRDPDRLDPERPHVERLARPHRPEVGALQQPVLAQLLGHQRQGHRGAVDGNVQGAQKVGHRTDVVFVAVRQEHGAKALTLVQGVGEVRDHVVDAEQLVVREHEPAVDRHQVVAGLEEHHVEPDLPEPAERNQADDGLSGGGCGLHANSFRMPATS